MTAKRYFVTCEVGDCICELISRKLSDDEFEHLTYQNITDKLNQLIEENEQLRKEKKCDKKVFTKKQLHEWLQQTREENEQLKIALKDKENLISICEKKFKELGYLITCDDDGYTVEKI